MFNPNDPFPLIDLKKVPYEAQKNHAAQVDAWLEMDAERIESQLEREVTDRQVIREQWVGLPVQSLLTPYTELRGLFEQLKALGVFEAGAQKPLKVVDIGAAYGRMGMVIHRHFPELIFDGIEICQARVEEGRRAYQKLGIPTEWLRQYDVLEEGLPPADLYFIYDFGTPRSIQKILGEIRDLARTQKVVVVGRGRSTRDQIEREHPWLGQMVEPVHSGHYSVYRNER